MIKERKRATEEEKLHSDKRGQMGTFKGRMKGGREGDTSLLEGQGSGLGLVWI